MRLANCQAILFDMDGTLVDSTSCVEAIWSMWAERHGIEPVRILSISHGRRTLDTLREVAPHLDIAQEAMLLDAQELEFTEGIKAVNGAAELLRGLPESGWAVVTSASRALARLRMQCAGLPTPSVLIGADDVAEGKPSPAGYLKAASLLGVEPAQCLVVEDTPAGVLAARTAGMEVLALTTTCSADRLLGAHCIREFSKIRVFQASRALEVHIL
jgi:mannitol-1-/sugar-/sorbitol-6-phosphatase